MAPNVPEGQAVCVEMQAPAAPQYPSLMGPSQVEAVRTLVLSPKRPAAHFPDPVAAVAPAFEKKPQFTSPSQSLVVRTEEESPKYPALQTFCVAEQEPAVHQWPALHSPLHVPVVRTVVERP